MGAVCWKICVMENKKYKVLESQEHKEWVYIFDLLFNESSHERLNVLDLKETHILV